MEILSSFLAAPVDFILAYIVPFVVVLSVLVFVHEWGHYIVARICGVRIETFSIGFGKELFGRTDKNGTRWKVSLLPLGGYVQMFGDVDPASAKHDGTVEENGKKRAFTAEEKKVAFYTQSVGRRSAIVFAGPAINFIFAIVILAGLFMVQGQPYTPVVAAKLVEGAPAEKAGVLPDDKILSVDGKSLERFQDLAQYIAINLDKEVELEVVRAVSPGVWSDKPVFIRMTPAVIDETDRFGFKHQRGRIGIIGPDGATEIKEHSVGSALVASVVEVWNISAGTLKAIGQMIVGTRSAEELGGILRIGAYAGEFAESGIVSLITFAALLSVNLGLINLLPIPLLDGGHLAFYAMETVKGKPLNEKVQEYALRFGMAFLLAIMLFATWNDLVQLKVFDYVIGLVS